MLGCDRIEINAFRILRLSGRAQPSEIDAAATTLRLAAARGSAGITKTDLLAVDAAVDALDHPRQRIEHRLFWFHDPACLENPAGAPASTALDDSEIAHDHALRSLVAAYFEDKVAIREMACALRQWHEFVSQPGYWHALGRIDPEATAEQIANLRHHAMVLAADPFVQAARDSWVGKELAAVRDYLTGLKELEHTGAWASECRQRLICKITAPLVDACGVFADRYRAQIIYRVGTERHNEPVCLEELRYFREFIEPAWNTVRAALPDDEAEMRLSRGQAADCLASIAVDHTWAGKHDVAQKLAAEAVTLAQDTVVEVRIRLALSILLEPATEADTEPDTEPAAEPDIPSGEFLVAGEQTQEAPALAQDIAPQPEPPAQTESRSTSNLTPESVVELVRQRCATLTSTFAGKIVPKHDCLVENQLVCAEEVTYFRTEIEPAFNQAMARLQPDAPVMLDLREKVAVCLANIATHYLWTGESTTAEDLLTESLGLADGTWAARSIRLKYLQARDASAKLATRKQGRWRVGFGASMAGVLLVAVMANRPGTPSIAAAPRTTSEPISDPLQRQLDQQIDQATTDLQSLEARIRVGSECAAGLERQVKTLHDEVESLKEDRAAGEPVDTAALNAKMYSYSSLLRASHRASSELAGDVRLHDQLVAEQRRLLDQRSR